MLENILWFQLSSISWMNKRQRLMYNHSVLQSLKVPERSNGKMSDFSAWYGFVLCKLGIFQLQRYVVVVCFVGAASLNHKFIGRTHYFVHRQSSVIHSFSVYVWVQKLKYISPKNIINCPIKIIILKTTDLPNNTIFSLRLLLHTAVSFPRQWCLQLTKWFG